MCPSQEPRTFCLNEKSFVQFIRSSTSWNNAVMLSKLSLIDFQQDVLNTRCRTLMVTAMFNKILPNDTQLVHSREILRGRN